MSDKQIRKRAADLGIDYDIDTYSVYGMYILKKRLEAAEAEIAERSKNSSPWLYGTTGAALGLFLIALPFLPIETKSDAIRYIAFGLGQSGIAALLHYLRKTQIERDLSSEPAESRFWKSKLFLDYITSFTNDMLITLSSNAVIMHSEIFNMSEPDENSQSTKTATITDSRGSRVESNSGGNDDRENTLFGGNAVALVTGRTAAHATSDFLTQHKQLIDKNTPIAKLFTSKQAASIIRLVIRGLIVNAAFAAFIAFAPFTGTSLGLFIGAATIFCLGRAVVESSFKYYFDLSPKEREKKFSEPGIWKEIIEETLKKFFGYSINLAIWTTLSTFALTPIYEGLNIVHDIYGRSAINALLFTSIRFLVTTPIVSFLGKYIENFADYMCETANKIKKLSSTPLSETVSQLQSSAHEKGEKIKDSIRNPNIEIKKPEIDFGKLRKEIKEFKFTPQLHHARVQAARAGEQAIRTAARAGENVAKSYADAVKRGDITRDGL